MKSISTLFRQLSLIVVLISAFSLFARGEEMLAYTISFENGGNSDATQALTTSNFIETVIIDGEEYVSSCTATSYCYEGKNAVKLGSSKKSGSFTLSLSTTGQINATKVIVYTSQYSSDSGNLQVSINNGSATSITPSDGSGTCSVNGTLNTIEISTSAKRAYVHKIEVYQEVTPIEPDCTDPTISFAESTITKTKGEVPFRNELNKGGSTGNVTYTTGNANIAIVNATTGEVTIVGVGTTNIIATVDADDTFCEATDEYTLIVEGRSFDITWINGAEIHTTTTYTEGDALTLPATDPTSCSDNYSTFIGWYSEPAGSTSNKSTELQGTEASKTDITGPTIFYAVFGEANGAPIPTESSIDFSAQNYTNQQEISSVSIAEGITVVFDKGTNSNSPKYYTNGTAIRAYGGNNFTISSETTISSITITFGDSDGSNAITTDCGTYSDGKWIGSANSVKFTIGGSSGNRRIQGITIEFESSASSTYISTCDKEDIPAIYATYDAIDFESIVENENSTKSTIITTVNLKEPANISISGTNASYFAVNPTSIDGNSETEITITFTAPDVDVETEYTATLTIKGGEQTKEIALTATVKPLLALTANINGLTQEIGAFVEGADITSALDAINVTAPEGWSFAGWVANAIDGSQTTTPEYLTTMPAEATTAYAVFKLGKEVNKEFSFAITAADFNETSYTANNNEKTSTATAIDGTETEVKWTSYQVMLQEKAMQWQKSNGYIYNSTDLGTITDIDITSSAGTFTTHKGTSEKPTSEGEGGYFQIKTGTSAVGKTSGVTITFEKSVLSYTYRTSVLSLVVENNTTETISENVNSLTLHVDKTPNTQLEVTETITADKVTVIQTIDASRWFFFSLPFDCNVANIVATYVNGGAELEYAPDASTGDYVIAEYDGTNSWVELLGDNNPTLKANQGYIIGHFGSGDVTVKFPSNGAQNISAPANATLEKTSNNGFNLIGLPYFQKVNASLNNVNHLSIPNEDGETYNQTEDLSLLASIAPFTSFFVQTEAENIEFTLGAQQNAAPRLDGRSNRASLHKAVVTLTDANGGADKTTIINNPSKTTDYEIGHDLTKLIGYAEIPQIYSLQGDEMLAFNSLAIDNSTVIPLGVYAHADGDYTFSLSEKSVGDLEGWELYDNETGKTTRLANEDLTVNLAQGTHEGRFEIRLQQHISTDCDNTMGDMTTWTANGTLNINNLPADAVVYIYDAVGRMVYVANNNSTTFNYTFAARGVYNIVVRTAENSVSFKTIY